MLVTIVAFILAANLAANGGIFSSLLTTQQQQQQSTPGNSFSHVHSDTRGTGWFSNPPDGNAYPTGHGRDQEHHHHHHPRQDTHGAPSHGGGRTGGSSIPGRRVLLEAMLQLQQRYPVLGDLADLQSQVDGYAYAYDREVTTELTRRGIVTERDSLKPLDWGHMLRRFLLFRDEGQTLPRPSQFYDMVALVRPLVDAMQTRYYKNVDGYLLEREEMFVQDVQRRLDEFYRNGEEGATHQASGGNGSSRPSMKKLVDSDGNITNHFGPFTILINTEQTNVTETQQRTRNVVEKLNLMCPPSIITGFKSGSRGADGTSGGSGGSDSTNSDERQQRQHERSYCKRRPSRCYPVPVASQTLDATARGFCGDLADLGAAVLQMGALLSAEFSMRSQTLRALQDEWMVVTGW